MAKNNLCMVFNIKNNAVSCFINMYRGMTAVIFGDNKAGFGEIRTANQTQCVLPAKS